MSTKVSSSRAVGIQQIWLSHPHKIRSRQQLPYSIEDNKYSSKTLECSHNAEKETTPLESVAATPQAVSSVHGVTRRIAPHLFLLEECGPDGPTPVRCSSLIIKFSGISQNWALRLALWFRALNPFLSRQIAPATLNPCPDSFLLSPPFSEQGGPEWPRDWDTKDKLVDSMQHSDKRQPRITNAHRRATSVLKTGEEELRSEVSGFC
ncbi:hypothetical protein L210DRAFT_2298500 [Boletus edulis BED1]|uniref:Uncharacterized protein n=1 Tax=Boletus edulis BED1 TaxID=1328754 RepID=A0AAD4BRK8_BOLED|nr:hypothetical protein L210DRAFT_2298500 [Boletus edulis BED1]